MRSRLSFVALRLGLCLTVLGCTEDPRLDKVGGSGNLAPDGNVVSDTGPSCGTASPDAAPRSLPCDVQAVLELKCQRCHNSNAELDRCYPAKTCLRGPFPLLTWFDTHVIFDGTPVFERMQKAIETDYMPFKTTQISPPVVPLEAFEKALLLAWTRSCAPASSVACPRTDSGAGATGALQPN